MGQQTPIPAQPWIPVGPSGGGKLAPPDGIVPIDVGPGVVRTVANPCGQLAHSYLSPISRRWPFGISCPKLTRCGSYIGTSSRVNLRCNRIMTIPWKSTYYLYLLHRCTVFADDNRFLRCCSLWGQCRPRIREEVQSRRKAADGLRAERLLHFKLSMHPQMMLNSRGSAPRRRM